MLATWEVLAGGWMKSSRAVKVIETIFQKQYKSKSAGGMTKW
jgi:hypothetical protein